MTTPAGTIRPLAGGVARRDSTGAGEPVEKLHRLDREAAEFVERLCSLHGSKAVAIAADRGYTAIRSWVGDPERIPLLSLPALLSLADRDDPFLPRLAAALGYRLLPLEPSPEQVVALLETAGVIKAGKGPATVAILRGVRRDSRQASLGFEP